MFKTSRFSQRQIYENGSNRPVARTSSFYDRLVIVTLCLAHRAKPLAIETTTILRVVDESMRKSCIDLYYLSSSQSSCRHPADGLGIRRERTARVFVIFIHVRLTKLDTLLRDQIHVLFSYILTSPIGPPSIDSFS